MTYSFAALFFAQCRYSSVKMSRISPSSCLIEQNIGLAKLYVIHWTRHYVETTQKSKTFTTYDSAAIP